MDFSEFKRRLGADPGATDPAMRLARESAPEFEQAAAEADRFEKALHAALEVPVDDGLVDELAGLSRAPGIRRGPPRWLAMAASLVVAVGAVLIYWSQRVPQDVHEYVAQHIAHDGAQALAGAAAPAATVEIERVLARFAMDAGPALSERIRLIKFCPTPDGRGAHMVLATESGPVQLLYMPETPVTDGEEFVFDGMQTRLLALERGSAALVGTDRSELAGLSQVVRTSLRPLQNRT